MKVLLASFAIVTFVAWSCASALADDKAPGGGGPGGAVGAMERGGGGGAVHVQAPSGGASVKASDGGGANVQAPSAKVEVNRDGMRDSVRVDADRARVGADVNRDRNDFRFDNRGYSVYRNNLGTRDFDKRGIGRIDEDRFRDRSGNNWRYAHWHNQWWYWLPAGYWAYWNGDRWNRYDYDTYADNYSYQQQPTGANNATGPYYEDQQGFFYYDSGRKVYDQQIQRVNSAAARPGPYTR